MEWFEQHSYLAAWLALPVAILVPFLQYRSGKTKEIDWFNGLKYLAFFICLAVMLTPTFDESARTSARTLVFMSLGYFFATEMRSK